MRQQTIREALVLKSVDLDVSLLECIFAHFGLVFVGKKNHNFGTMISLELNHFAHVLILNDGAIASIFLFESL